MSMVTYSARSFSALEPGQIPGFIGQQYLPAYPRYTGKVQQYARSYGSYPKESMSPGIIACPLPNTQDIQVAIEYAQTNGMNIVARSGGHQYSGLSSGDSNYVMLDMTNYNDLNVNDNILSAGVFNNLGKVGRFIDSNGLALPFGDCYSVNIGGHVQTGGFGNILRGFGFHIDYVKSFDIVDGLGNSRTITKPSNVLEESENNDLYWAVLGGNPNSFGIITNIEYECIRNSDYPHTFGKRQGYLYDKQLLNDWMTAYQKLLASNELPADYDLMITCVSADESPTKGFMFFEGIYSNASGRDDYDSQYFDLFREGIRIPDDPYACNEEAPLSELMLKFLLLHPGRPREFPKAYCKSANATREIWNQSFADSFVEKVDLIISQKPYFSLSSQMQFGGGRAYTNDPNRILTSLSHRDCIDGFTFDIFYDEGYEQEAQQIRNECRKLWVGSEQGLYSTEDIRWSWGTFGDVDINNVWPFYYDNEEQYQRLKKVKKFADPNNIFKTSFTIPIDE